MTNAFIIHGAYGYPEENWFPWLKKELEKLGHNVFVPQFPSPEGHTLENWMKVFEEYRDKLNEETIIIAHSMGPSFILNVLETLEKPIKAAFFVAGFTGPLGIEKFDTINVTFTEKDFDWDKIKQNCKKFYVFNSDNDPYVPLEKGENLAKDLGVELIFVKNAGHFGTKAGYEKFELLLEKIKEEIK